MSLRYWINRITNVAVTPLQSRPRFPSFIPCQITLHSFPITNPQPVSSWIRLSKLSLICIDVLDSNQRNYEILRMNSTPHCVWNLSRMTLMFVCISEMAWWRRKNTSKTTKCRFTSSSSHSPSLSFLSLRSCHLYPNNPLFMFSYTTFSSIIWIQKIES